MNKMFAAFLQKLTFQRQLGIVVTLGILFLALFSAIVGSWRGNERVRIDLIKQGQHITENLAQQSALALIYSSADNVSEAVSVTLTFPGVIGVEIRDEKQHILLKRGNPDSTEFPSQIDQAAGTYQTSRTQAAAVLDAESSNAWRFSAPVYSQPSSSPFKEVTSPELLGHVTVVLSKAALAQMSSDLFISNLTISFSFAFLFLFLIRILTLGMTRPLNQLSACMGRAEAGESQVRAVLAGPRDIADMAHAFNSMMSVQEERDVKILQLNSDLEQRVVERTAELTTANRELESFAYAVSHDLRAPLRAMSGFSHALVEDYGDKLERDAKNYLDQIDIASRKMGELIDGILALSRITRGEMKQVPIDVSTLAAQLFEELSHNEPERKVNWQVEPNLRATGDTIMIEAVLRNLLGNAWKYTGKTDAAVIRVFWGEIEGKQGFCVADNGAGFDNAHIDRLFKPFQRLHRQDEFPGLGIGLATVQRIINRHGGEVFAKGLPGNGATFCFTLHEMSSEKASY